MSSSEAPCVNTFAATGIRCSQLCNERGCRRPAPTDSLSLSTFFIDCDVEFDKTHWIPKTREGVPLSAPEFDPLFNTPQVHTPSTQTCGQCEHLDSEHRHLSGCTHPDQRADRFVHVVFIASTLNERELNPFEVRATGSAEPIAVTTSVESAHAARRLLR